MNTPSPFELFGAGHAERIREGRWRQSPSLLRGCHAFGSALFDRCRWERAAATYERCVVGVIEPEGGERSVHLPAAAWRELAAAGAAVILENLSAHDADLARLATALAKELGEVPAVDAKAFLAPRGPGFPMHFDPYPIIVTVVSGRKKWTFDPRPVRPPDGFLPGSFTPPAGESMTAGSIPYGDASVAAPRESHLQHAILERGDVLLMPAGTWHLVEPVDDSLQVTLGFPGGGRPAMDDIRVVDHCPTTRSREALGHLCRIPGGHTMADPASRPC